MKTTRPYPSLLLAAACTALLLCPALSARADNRETNTIKFSDPAKPGTLKVSLTMGDIRITGGDAAEIVCRTEMPSSWSPAAAPALPPCAPRSRTSASDAPA